MQVWMVEEGVHSDYMVAALAATADLAKRFAEVLYYRSIEPAFIGDAIPPWLNTVASLDAQLAICRQRPQPEIVWRDDQDGVVMLLSHRPSTHRSYTRRDDDDPPPYETGIQITPMNVLGLGEVVLSPELARQLEDSQRRFLAGEQPKPWDAAVAEAQTEHCAE